MLSIDFIINNKNKVKEALKNKNREADVDKIISLDKKRRELILHSESLRRERNLIAKKHGEKSSIQRGKKIKAQLKLVDGELKRVKDELNNLLSYLVNIPLDSVPVGKDESGNVEIKRWGEIPKFDFTPRSHIEIGESLDLFDTKRGVKVSGFRGYFLKNELAQMHIALLFYVFNKIAKKGYTPMIAPAIVKGFTLFGSGQFPWGEQEVYKLNDNDSYLAGTAEQPVTSYYSDEILAEKELPKKFVAFSPCFRKEAGAYGKDTKGLYRLHEFWKVEQVIISTNDINKSIELHEELQRNTEEVIRELKLPYRVLLMCTGDMGEPQVKKYDIEVWMPSRNSFGEAASNSIMTDFQSRRLNIRYRDKDGKINFVHTLNNTGVASPRILISILENYQQKDGSVLVPELLQQYLPFKKIEPRT